MGVVFDAQRTDAGTRSLKQATVTTALRVGPGKEDKKVLIARRPMVESGAVIVYLL